MNLDSWDPFTPAEVAGRLKQTDVRWAVAGGWAIDLFAGATSRPHEDLEIVCDHGSFPQIRDAFPELQWHAAADGQLTALDAGDDSLDDSWQTWGWEASAERWRIDVMRERWEYSEWVYRRNPAIRLSLDRAITQTPAGIPCLAPEIVLLFKAKHQRAKDEQDFQLASTLMAPERLAWLRTILETEHPGHSWLTTLS